ncbi:MAG: sulfite exporter TauE/SafE family protein [Frankiales bacterium]|nr:MAG: sulfite exporter TauE/SafE family protein [Frankiales bacterium]
MSTTVREGGPVDVELEQLLVLCAFAFLAGGLDAIVGGGGLVQLPALLVVLPQAPVVALLGTNKLASVVGTASAAITYNRRISVDRRTAAWMAGSAFVGSAAGALLATRVGSDVLKPVVLVALVAVLAYTARTPSLGEVELLRMRARAQRATAVGGGALIGFYDGFVGPGTGSFLVFLLVGAVGLSFLHASATAKVVNTSTNAAALALFAWGGHVLWVLGAAMALSNLAGSQVGTRLAIRRGSAWVRRVFLVVVSALVLRLAYDVLT